MREPKPNDSELFGMLAEFDRPDRLIESVRLTRAHGFRHLDAYSPFRIDEVAQALDFADHRVAWLTFAGGMLGAAAGYGIQLYTNWSYPIDVGGRAHYAWPAFLVITPTLATLFAVAFAVGGMLLLNHLPRLNHPLFGVDGFQLASADRFFLVVFGTDPKFHEARTRAFLQELDPLRIETVAHSEQPE